MSAGENNIQPIACPPVCMSAPICLSVRESLILAGGALISRDACGFLHFDRREKRFY